MKLAIITFLSLFSIILAACNDDSNDQPCKAAFTKCSIICTDTLVDTNNCGACGNSCNGSSCENGVCSNSCENSALHNCSGKCVALDVSSENCGGCGIKCPSSHQCIATRCHVKGI